MACLKKNLVAKVENQMTTVSQISLACGKCSMLYTNYKHLLEHLYWRHGTEGAWCKTCGLKQWQYAPHVCHVLPINDDILQSNELFERESDYCFCGKFVEESPMIGCDGPHCVFQWYHFKCVGIDAPPEGDWLCPECIKIKTLNKKDFTQIKSIGIR